MCENVFDVKTEMFCERWGIMIRLIEVKASHGPIIRTWKKQVEWKCQKVWETIPKMYSLLP